MMRQLNAMRRLWLSMMVFIALVLSGGWHASALAHEISMAEMQVREIAPGEFFWQWGTTEKRAAKDDLTPVWPENCVVEGSMLHCGEDGLQGKLSVDGVGKAYSAALVKITWRNGDSRVYTLTAGQPTVHLYGGAEDQRGMAEVASAYVALGVEHILSGVDHLLFVISLLFLVGFNRRLLWTITAFTAAHSLTLGLSALGWLVLRSPPVEASIALSIVLVAGEALHTQMTLSRRWPALVAFLFGLVHGLGFAGALKEIGLPEHHMLVALLTFNVGVEIGQLMTVAAAWGLWRVASRWPWFAAARMPTLYGIGTVASFWAWSRVVAIFS
jgi:hydrogenase/urease accessory protein HupE